MLSMLLIGNKVKQIDCVGCHRSIAVGDVDPIFCPTCKELLPDASSMLVELDMRVIYHQDEDFFL